MKQRKTELQIDPLQTTFGHRNRPNKFHAESMKKILIIRLSSIGDIVLTTPVIRCLKQQLPQAELHFLVKKQFFPVVEQNPYISKIHLLEHDFGTMMQALKDENFDYVIDLHKNLRTTRIKLLLRKPNASFSKLNIKKWLMVHFKIKLLPKIHIVERYFEAVKKMNVVNDGKGLDFFIGEENQMTKDFLPDGFFENFSLLVIGGAHETKQIPIEKAVEICKMISHPMVICGGKTDREKGDIIAKNSGNHVFNTAGMFSLGQSASLIQHAQQVITSDTGMMHIAAAFNKKIVSLWGNTIPQFGMYPYMPQNQDNSIILEVKSLKCRPCSKIGFEKCPKGHFRCMKEIVLDKKYFI